MRTTEAAVRRTLDLMERRHWAPRSSGYCSPCSTARAPTRNFRILVAAALALAVVVAVLILALYP